VAGNASTVDAGADYQDIVHDAEATLARHPLALATDQVTVRQHGGFVHVDTATVELTRDGHVLWLEEVPA